MSIEKLDNEELLRLSLDAINRGADADSLVLLKTLLAREPNHVYATYLMAAQHAQLGMFDRAEEGFRAVVAGAPEFSIARFQLCQLLIMKGAQHEARQLLAPLLAQRDALGAYARALDAAAADDVPTAIVELEGGLQLMQENPALEGDMRRLLIQFRGVGTTGAEAAPAEMTLSTPMLLSNYQRGNL